MTKICTKCGIEKDLSEFSRTLFGHRSDCKECHNVGVRQWKKENKDKVIANNAKWQKANPEKHRKWDVLHPESHRAASNRYYANNKEKATESTKRYEAKNPEVRRSIKRNRRAREEYDGGNVTPQEWQTVLSRYGNKCLCCGRSDVKLTMDHIKPLKIGGKHEVSNVQPLCQSCNSKKATKHIDYRSFS